MGFSLDFYTCYISNDILGQLRCCITHLLFHTSMLPQTALLHFHNCYSKSDYLSPTNSFSKGLFLNPHMSKAAFNTKQQELAVKIFYLSQNILNEWYYYPHFGSPNTRKKKAISCTSDYTNHHHKYLRQSNYCFLWKR